MKKWSRKEYSIAEWAITYISEMSLSEKHRKTIKAIKERPLSQHKYYSALEKEALLEAMEHLKELYAYSIKDVLIENKTVKSVKKKIETLSSAIKKLEITV